MLKKEGGNLVFWEDTDYPVSWSTIQPKSLKDLSPSVYRHLKRLKTLGPSEFLFDIFPLKVFYLSIWGVPIKN